MRGQGSANCTRSSVLNLKISTLDSFFTPWGGVAYNEGGDGGCDGKYEENADCLMAWMINTHREVEAAAQ